MTQQNQFSRIYSEKEQEDCLEIIKNYQNYSDEDIYRAIVCYDKSDFDEDLDLKVIDAADFVVQRHKEADEVYMYCRQALAIALFRKQNYGRVESVLSSMIVQNGHKWPDWVYVKYCWAWIMTERIKIIAKRPSKFIVVFNRISDASNSDKHNIYNLLLERLDALGIAKSEDVVGIKSLINPVIFTDQSNDDTFDEDVEPSENWQDDGGESDKGNQKDEEIKALRDQIAEKDKIIADREDKLKIKDKDIADKTKVLTEIRNDGVSFSTSGPIKRADRILILGEARDVGRERMIKLAKKFGCFDERNLDFCIEYEKIKCLGDRIQPGSYRGIILGAMPHSVTGKEGESSLVEFLLNNLNEYPNVIKCTAENGKLKITKSSFVNAVRELKCRIQMESMK